MLSTLSNSGGLGAYRTLAVLSAPHLQRVLQTALFSTIAAASQQQHREPRLNAADPPFVMPSAVSKRQWSPDALEWHERLRRLDFGSPHGHRSAAKAATGISCKPIEHGQHAALQHSHHESNVVMGIAAHLR